MRGGAGLGHPPHLQAGGHLRRRVRRLTPYFYSTYERKRGPAERKKVVILGSGPNRIGQGIEFDYCCGHAAYALQDAGYESIMVNCNPETVSTDYDTSDRLYFEPSLRGRAGTSWRTETAGRASIVQFGGQTAINSLRSLFPGAGCPSSAPAPTPSTWPGPQALRAFPGRARHTPAAGRGRTSLDEGLNIAASATRCWCAPATCSGGRPWKSSTTNRLTPWGGGEGLPNTPSSSISSSKAP